MSDPLSEDVRCNECGYSLRGLDARANCPECGVPVAEALRGDELRFASRAWVRRLRRGALLILVALIVLMLESIVDATRSLWISAGGQGALLVRSAVLFALEALAAATVVVGVFWFTSRDPSESLCPEQPGHRRLVRRLALVALVPPLLLPALSTRLPANLSFLLFVVRQMAVIMCLFFLPVVLLLHARVLALRLKSPEVIPLIWIVVAAFVASGGMALLARFSVLAGGPWPVLIWGLGILAGGGLAMVLIIVQDELTNAVRTAPLRSGTTPPNTSTDSGVRTVNTEQARAR